MGNLSRNKGEQAKVADLDPWGYRRQSLVDRALGAMACAVSGHRWWRVIDVRVCGTCGKVER